MVVALLLLEVLSRVGRVSPMEVGMLAVLSGLNGSGWYEGGGGPISREG